MKNSSLKAKLKQNKKEKKLKKNGNIKIYWLLMRGHDDDLNNT